MDMLDSQAEEHRAAVARAGATRRARARRAPPAPADQNPEIQPFPAWARPRGEDGDAAFSAGAGLALFDKKKKIKKDKVNSIKEIEK
jgi:ferric-dicitrate binding protein FerR (iron transport regulator)